MPGGVETAYRVTALVSTFKSERFLPGCLEDLMAQTLYTQGALEIVVVDSGSPEREGDITRRYQALSPHLRYVRTERETIYAAWSRAARLARGTYLTNANTDDRHHPEALARLATILDTHPGLGLVYADSFITDVPNESWATHTAREKFRWPRFSVDALVHQNLVGPHPLWRRSLHDRWGYFSPAWRVAGDWEFWLRVAEGTRLAHVPETLGLYHRNRDGLELSSPQTRGENERVRRLYQSRMVAGQFMALNHPTLWSRGGARGPAPSPDPLVAEAARLVGLDQSEAARERLLGALRVSWTPEVLLALSHVLALETRLGPAAEILEQGLRAFPRAPSLVLRLAQLRALEGKSDESAACLERAFALAPEAAAAVGEDLGFTIQAV